MQKLLDYLNQWDGARLDVSEFWEAKKVIIGFHLKQYESYLLKNGIIKKTIATNDPSERYEDFYRILNYYYAVLKDPGLSMEPEFLCRCLAAAYLFYDSIIFSLNTPSPKLLAAIDAFVLHATVKIAGDMGRGTGERMGVFGYRKEGIRKRRSRRREQAGTDDRANNFLKAAKDCLDKRSKPFPSWADFRREIEKRMKADPDKYSHQKPYTRNPGNKLLQENFPDSTVAT